MAAAGASTVEMAMSTFDFFLRLPPRGLEARGALGDATTLRAVAALERSTLPMIRSI
jgi:hypothetical protein